MFALNQPHDVHAAAAALSDHFVVSEVDDGRYLVEGGQCRLWIDGWSEVDAEYPEPPAAMSRLMSPTLVMVNYSRGIELAREVARRLAEEFICVVDTDFGLIVEGSVFRRLLEDYPSWDWRSQADPRCSR